MTSKPGKPLYGDPCNGCGLCCLSEQCPISLDIFGDVGICPALMDEGARWSCGLIVKPELFFPALPAELSRLTALMLGQEGCDSVDSHADRRRQRGRVGDDLRARALAKEPEIDALMAEVAAKLRIIGAIR